MGEGMVKLSLLFTCVSAATVHLSVTQEHIHLVSCRPTPSPRLISIELTLDQYLAKIIVNKPEPHRRNDSQLIRNLAARGRLGNGFTPLLTVAFCQDSGYSPTSDRFNCKIIEGTDPQTVSPDKVSYPATKLVWTVETNASASAAVIEVTVDKRVIEYRYDSSKHQALESLEFYNPSADSPDVTLLMWKKEVDGRGLSLSVITPSNSPLARQAANNYNCKVSLDGRPTFHTRCHLQAHSSPAESQSIPAWAIVASVGFVVLAALCGGLIYCRHRRQSSRQQATAATVHQEHRQESGEVLSTMVDIREDVSLDTEKGKMLEAENL